jgi:hypothetical protein
MTNNKQQTPVEWLERLYNSRPAYEEFISYEEFEQAKEMEKEEKLKLIKFTSEIFELGKAHFNYALITNEEILELYNETNGTNNEGNSK